MWSDCANDPEGLALLRAAVSNPGNRSRRLVLADWPQEHGEDHLADSMRRSVAECDWVYVDRPLRGSLKWMDQCYDGWPGLSRIPDIAASNGGYWPHAADLPQGLRAMAALPVAPWITSLRLHGQHVTDEVLKELVGFPNLVVLFGHSHNKQL